MTTDKARAEAEAIMWRHALQPEHGRRFIPDPEAMTAAIADALTARDAEAAAKLARVEANVARWQHEAEGLREAVRVLRNGVGPLVSACEECVKNSCGYDDDEWAIEAPITWGMIRNAKAALDAAGGAQ